MSLEASKFVSSQIRLQVAPWWEQCSCRARYWGKQKTIFRLSLPIYILVYMHSYMYNIHVWMHIIVYTCIMQVQLHMLMHDHSQVHADADAQLLMLMFSSSWCSHWCWCCYLQGSNSNAPTKLVVVANSPNEHHLVVWSWCSFWCHDAIYDRCWCWMVKSITSKIGNYAASAFAHNNE